MNVASPELSQELYELSKWCPSERCNGIHYATSPPPYDLGYLMRKLPERTSRIEDTVMLGRATDNNGWSTVYREFVFIDATPENAAALLAIELFKQGILTQEATS